MDDLVSLDALGQAELVRTGQVTPRELTEAAIRRAEALNPQLNAIITPLYEQALAQADELEATGRVGAGPQGDRDASPLAGVPFLIKDLNTAVSGVPMSCGSRFLDGWVPGYESNVTARYRQAGLVLLGLTNVPELGLLPTTEPLRFGATRNPWDLSRTAGGSSGGAAAAVAAGIVPAAHATDGGGSIRIPAACCGLFGLKPTRGRVSPAPGIYDPAGLAVHHAVTRTVRDSAALLDVAAGPAPGDAYWAEPPARPFLAEVGADPGRLRIAYSIKAINDAPVGPEQAHAVTDTAQLLTDLGHDVEEASLPVDAGFIDAFLALWTVGATASVDAFPGMAGRSPDPNGWEPFTWAMAERGRRIPGAQTMASLSYMQLLTRRIAAFMARYDVLLMPALAQPPLPLGTIDPSSDDVPGTIATVAAFMPHMPLANATGQPAMTVPLFEDAAGLPLAVQFYGRYADEATLLRLAAQLEEARPWADRRPPHHA